MVLLHFGVLLRFRGFPQDRMDAGSELNLAPATDDFEENEISQEPLPEVEAVNEEVLAASGTGSSASPSAEVVKVAVTVNGKSQLLVLPQSEALESVIRRLCLEHGLKWRQGWFALQLAWGGFGRSTASRRPGSLKYVTNENRGEIKNGAELKLTYAPPVYCDVILERLSSSKRRPEDRSWGFGKLAELAPDLTFLSVFAGKPRAVDQVLALLRSEGRDDRLGTRELQGALRVVLWLLHYRLLPALDDGVVRRVASIVRADYTVDGDVLETSLKILVELSLAPWELVVVQEVRMTDLVPLLWDQDRAGVQTAALELMTTLAYRQTRDGPGSPEAAANVIKILTSQQVRDTVARCVLPGPVDSAMARQLFVLQCLLLRPLRDALNTEQLPDTPPQLPARRRTKSNTLLTAQPTLSHSRSWTPGTPGTPDVPVEEAGGHRRPPSDPPPSTSPPTDYSSAHYKVLGSVIPSTVSSPVSRPPSGHEDAAWKRSSGDSISSFSSGIGSGFRFRAASSASLASQDSTDTIVSWQVDSDEPVPHAAPGGHPGAPLGLSKLGAQCLQYLRTRHPIVADRGAAEEEAMRGSFTQIAERLVRVLAEELRLGEDPAPVPSPTPSPFPSSSLSASTLTLSAPVQSPPSPETLSSRSGGLYQPLVFSTSIDEPFFEELFCLGVNLLAKTRREMRARTARDQDKVFRVLQRQFREALAAQVSSWGQLESWLSELPYSAVAALWQRERAEAERSTTLGSAAAQQLRKERAKECRQLVRLQRIATLRAGARFCKLHHAKGKRGSGDSAYTFAWLAQGDSALQYADCTEDSKVLGAPKVLPLSSVTAVVPGRKIRQHHVPKNKKLGSFPAFSLLLDPYDNEAKSLDFVAPDVVTMEHWVDGFNMLLGKCVESASVRRDVDLLLDMEMRLQLMELDGFPIPLESPEQPPPPPDFNFVT